MKRVNTRFTERAQTCAICFSLIEIQGELNTCKHYFCQECILKWSQVIPNQTENRCPICKARFSVVRRKPQRTHYTDSKDEEIKLIPDRSQKKEEISQLLESVQNILRSNYHEYSSL